MDGSRGQLCKIKSGIALVSLEGCDESFRGGLRSAVCKRRKRTVNYIDAGEHRHEIRHISGTRRVVRVKVDRHADLFLQRLHKLESVLRKEEVCHILDADSIGAHLLKLTRKGNEVIVIVNGAYRVADRGFTYAAVFFR